MEELNPDNIDWKVAEYHVMGDSNPIIAKKLGINRSTVWRRLQTPQCQAVIHTIRNIFYNSLGPHIYAGAIEASNYIRKKIKKGEATVAEAVAYLRISKDFYLKDFIAYLSEDPEIISREQYPKNFNIRPQDRLNSINLEEE
jgi:DNA-binding Lrp family transcriptional regulator